MSTASLTPKARRYLSADGLIEILKQRFQHIEDPRRGSHLTYPLPDVLMAAFAMFSLKDPSLLAFGDRQDDPSLKNIYRIENIPSDSQMREILDPIDVEHLNEAFADVFHELQRGGVLKRFRFQGDQYLVAIDGTGYFCSSAIRCPHCLVKKSSDGKTKYSHHAVAAVLIHPDLREVIPLAVEPIIKQDGETKNDCERNATRRLLGRVKQLHPRLKLIVTEDGISSNAPHIRDLQEFGYGFILGAQPGDHTHLFDQVLEAGEESNYHSVSIAHTKGKTETSWVKDLPLNKSHEDIRVNYIGQVELSRQGDVRSRFAWVTDQKTTAQTVQQLARGGRCRWRIENETFNTLKNQGYHFEHNYGHGQQHLSTVLMLLMMLAFLVDQVQQLCCPLFQSVLAKVKRRKTLWHRLRCAVESFTFRSYREVLEAILSDRSRRGWLPP